ncbi:MAG: shikimate kinase [Elusimicrobiales bacterium]|nr:shikimate kinase [Elusimicrobiales bacterium]
MKIILYGFMASGKTTIGKAFAKRIGFKFYDTDKTIEKRLKISVYDFIKTYGIKKFRYTEKRILNELLNMNDNLVISCGGGIFPKGKTNKDIIEVFIDTPYEIISKRFRKASKTRPILRKLINSPNSIKRLYNKRLNFYKKARYSINEKDLKKSVTKLIDIYEKLTDKNK